MRGLDDRSSEQQQEASVKRFVIVNAMRPRDVEMLDVPS